MSQRTVDRIIVLFLLVMSISLYVIAEGFPSGADTFPKVMLSFIFIFSLILLWTTFRSKKIETSNEVKIDFRKAGRPYLTLIFCVIYVFGVQYLGFFVSTAIFGALFMMYLGVKNYLTILISLASLLSVVYLLFVLQLRVPLPKGILF
ncbi:tripartite tricarboxylate transporter TctB family protein [Desulfosporosinus sp. BICA1-9]|uniref:tripartite tricarboxylate transporter TctB family protein n=1 Tax=Desulfosporosinus sp. BICA1-9 TaxID=1531958 RepID=UPI00054C0929|nr:tripartite tricarboxylate transporter TctB family protein [Desulfosporosinus sp. BICA1-9]KJS47419.1 MAG: hypothetical protein VR66_19805 [Peptococcaceae bacterium BRH_c23]KJS88334.1 MAG: hypothetical protein JL57_12140 [Desulfosporosinus sp. BICA1-9]HBW38032.1 tripartite tricarboxylate transporter TctB family protein [Desulfosporosinus sp.]